MRKLYNCYDHFEPMVSVAKRQLNIDKMYINTLELLTLKR